MAKAKALEFLKMTTDRGSVGVQAPIRPMPTALPLLTPPHPLTTASTHCNCPHCSSSPRAGCLGRSRHGHRPPVQNRCEGRSPRSCRPGTHTSVGRAGPRCRELPLLPPLPLISSSNAHWTHLVEWLGVHHSVALLKHTALPQQHGAVGLCTHLWGTTGAAVGILFLPHPNRLRWLRVGVQETHY